MSDNSNTFLYKEIELFSEKLREYFRSRSINPRAFVHSFGCQQNVSDGERMMGILSQAGYSFVTSPQDADLVLYNTCAVRETAESRVFGMIGELKAIKKQNPDMIISICGCMAQQENIQSRIKKSYPYVDIVFGTFAMHELLAYIYGAITERKRIFDNCEHTNYLIENLSPVRSSSFKASVPIIYGCNNFCTYCIVPYVRGRERSREAADIIREVSELAEKGYKEIMLLGQNVNSYGKGLSSELSFTELLYKLNSIDGDFKIRFMSPHPKDMTRELIDAVYELDKVAKHIHLPLQSGSDRILREMNRRYTAEKYLDTVDYIRRRDPGFSITTDIIVGFPNESEEDFAATLDVVKKVKYDNIFSFIYSKRSGTAAAEMEDPISAQEKSERMGRLLSLQREISSEHYRRFIGRRMRVLAEERSKKEGFLVGKSDEFIIVEFQGDESLIGNYCDIFITDAYNWALSGKL